MIIEGFFLMPDKLLIFDAESAPGTGRLVAVYPGRQDSIHLLVCALAKFSVELSVSNAAIITPY